MRYDRAYSQQIDFSLDVDADHFEFLKIYMLLPN